MREQFTNTAQTSLNNGGTLTSGATSLVVKSATGFPTSGNFRVLIDAEILLVTAVAGTTFTVTRGQESTAGASHADGSVVTHLLTAGSQDQSRLDNLQLETVEGRLTLTTATPVTPSDVTAATTLYFTPYRGNRIAVYNGTEWVVNTFAEVSVAVPATTATMYDVFAVESAGTLAIEALAWTNDTTRATALATQDGVLVKTSDHTRRYLGSFRTTGVSGQTEDSLLKRYVWNYYNRVRKNLKRQDTTATWTYGTAAWHQANASGSNQVEVVVGWQEALVELAYATIGTGSVQSAVGIGIDVTNANSADANQAGTANSSILCQLSAHLRHMPAVGRHFYAMLEFSNGSSTTFWGTGSTSFTQTGMTGSVDC